MTRTNILKRPFYLGLIVLFSAFASTATIAPTFAQDAEPADNAAAVAAEEPAATETTAAEEPAATESTAAEEPAATESTAAEEPAATETTADANVEEEVEIAATEPTEATEKSNLFPVLLLFVAIVAVAWALAFYGAKKFRQPNFKTAYFIIVFCFVGALISTVLGLKQGRVNLGVDLRGGSILVYSVSPIDANQTSVDSEQMNDLKNALSRRINPSGVREISIQELGANTEIRITIPEADEAEVERLERVINNAGQLKFRILAISGSKYPEEEILVNRAQNPDFADAWHIALDADQQTGGVIKGATWVPVDPAQEDSVGSRNLTRPSQAKEVKGQAKPNFDVLVLELDEAYNVAGSHMAQVNDSFGAMGKPEIVFEMNPLGAERMRNLTTEFESRQLGVVMNDRLHSAPNINEPIGKNGSINFGENLSADDFERIQKDVNDLVAVMRAGVLPAKLSEEPVTKMTTGPTLGADTIAKGKNAILWGGVLVLLFMIAYYGFGGLIATFAVLTNLVMIMSAMIAMRAAFTLPGLAGLV
ncbi:MAG: hypothetical protein IJ991_00295, partial [Thermoguttaceae bacterium]|nr:hypothetical protein [Thermoguttaceae bacterium]